MSRTLRIIDGILIALLIIAAALTYLPQVFGVNTVAVGADKLGNAEVGSLIYSEQEKTSSVQKGDSILNLTDDAVSIYTVVSYDPSANTVDVEGGEETTYKLSENYLRVVRVIPYVGFFLLATQTQKGLIMLGVIVCYIIVSLVIAALIRKPSEYEDDFDDNYDDDDEEEDEFYRGLAEKKKDKDKDRGSDKKSSRHSSDRSVQKKPAKKAAKNTADRDDDGMTELSGDEVPEEAQADSSDRVNTQSLTDVQAALEAALEAQPLNHTGELPADQVASAARNSGNAAADDDPNKPNVNENGEIELAMPVRTADEILSKAYAAGLDPNVEEDKSTGVTLVDYSDCL